MPMYGPASGSPNASSIGRPERSDSGGRENDSSKSSPGTSSPMKPSITRSAVRTGGGSIASRLSPAASSRQPGARLHDLPIDRLGQVGDEEEGGARDVL